MVKEYLISAKAQLEERKKNEIATVARKVKAEKVDPFNVEIDKALQRALAELRDNLNNRILELQKAFEDEKHKMEMANVEKKEAYEKSVIASETANISAMFDKAIDNLEKQIAETEV